MLKKSFSTTIYIDTETSTINCTSMLGKDNVSLVHKVKHYSGGHFDETFFKTFGESVAEFAKERPSEFIGKTTLILPDNAVTLDIVNVPTMRKGGATRNALGNTLGELYRNLGELDVQSFIAAQNKQYTTYNVAIVQKELLRTLYSICSENRLLVNATTYAASATVAAASALSPKLKNANYLLIDIKRTYTRYIFVVNGRAAGFYHLPFGLDFLSRPRYVQEDMLFDHSMGELTVLNAKEKAKARRLSVLGEAAEYTGTPETEETPAEAPAEEPAEPDEEEEEESGSPEPFNLPTADRVTEETPKIMAKKTPRRLPKFMQRPIPESKEEIAQENFRVFMKWALTLIAGNDRITALGAPAFICVNLPEELGFVLDAANAEREEQGIEFRRLGTEEVKGEILGNLELFGGYNPKLIHAANKF